LDKLHRSFSRTGVRIWNSVSDDLCNSSKNKFKRKLHEILLSILIEEEDYVDLATIMKNFKHKLNYR
jgi:membrane carboxypeptidase/penicillin-binding protein